MTILSLERFFSPADHAAIEAAVREVEAQSAGEIIPYAVERSDRYARAIWTAATLGALAGSLAAAVIRWSGEFWGGPVALWIALPPATGAALGWLAAFILPALRRLLVPPEVLAERVRQRAAQAFVEEEVFRTRDRSGVLIFLSLFEHRVVVRADRGLDGVVSPREWEEVVDGHRGRHAPGPAGAGPGRRHPAMRGPGRAASRQGRTIGTSFRVSSAWAASEPPHRRSGQAPARAGNRARFTRLSARRASRCCSPPPSPWPRRRCRSSAPG